MVEVEFVGIIVAALTAGVVSFSLVILNKLSQVNEVAISTRGKLERTETRLNIVEERISKICERVEDLTRKQSLDSYIIDELKKRKDFD
jgi:hypothetical protein